MEISLKIILVMIKTQLMMANTSFLNYLMMDTLEEFKSKCLVIINESVMTKEDVITMKVIHTQLKMVKMDEEHVLRDIGISLCFLKSNNIH